MARVEGLLLFNYSTRGIHFLEGLAAKLWEVCEGKSAEEIAHSLKLSKAEVERFLAELEARMLVRYKGEGSEADNEALSTSGKGMWNSCVYFDSPIFVQFDVTNACNLRCAHCSVAGGEAARDELDTSEIKHVLDQLAELRVPYVTFTGGEPLLRRDAIKLIAYASSLGLRPNLDTNGMLINPAKAKRLKEAGIGLVQVSIDGTEETHEKIRGQGSYAAAIRGAREVVRAGIPLHINFTLSKLNLSDLEAVVETASSLGARSLSLERFIAIGRGGAIAEQALSSEEFREALHRFFSLAEHTQVKLLTTDPLRVLIDSKLIERYREEMSRRVCGGCTAGIAALTISYDGEVCPCPKLPLSVGNVREQSITEIWQGNETLAALRAREFKGRCGECELVNLCGGCRGEAFARGDFLGEDALCWK